LREEEMKKTLPQAVLIFVNTQGGVVINILFLYLCEKL